MGSARAQTRHALLIGVGQYPAASSWPAINSANDLQIMQDVLLRQGFVVKTLADEKATKAGIVQQLEQLEQQAGPGDHVYLHFSGHGQQIQDDNNDEFDALDEALVPVDAPMEYTSGYKGEQHWRDDEIGAFLTHLRAKIGPSGQVFTVFDACHSGTATRGWGAVRGTETILAAPDTPLPGDPRPEASQADRLTGQEGLAPVVSFFAGSPQELNREYLAADGNYYGPLSYSLAKVWLAHLNDNITYRTMFQEVRAEMTLLAPRQHPRAEGTLDERLWGGVSGKSSEQYTVTSVWDATTIRIDAGELQGVRKNSVLRFESADGKQMLTRGKISEAGLSWAEVELDHAVGRTAILASRAIVEFRAPDNIRCAVRCVIAGNPVFAENLKKQFDRYGITQTTGPDFDLLLDLEEQGRCRIWTRDELLFFDDDLSATGFDAEYLVEEVFLPFIQAGFIRRLTIRDPALQAKIRIIPLDEAGNPIGKGENPNHGPDADLLQLEEGIRFVLEIENRGAEPFYFSILDLQPDNRMDFIVPEVYKRRTADDYYLEPGAKRRIEEVWEVSPPYGMEMFKLILSDKPLQLASIVKTRGQGTAGTTFFERLLAYSFQPGTRGAPVALAPAAPGERISLQDLPFEIVRKQK